MDRTEYYKERRQKLKKAKQAAESKKLSGSKWDEIDNWTGANLALDGLIETEGTFCSYGPDGFIYVSPERGRVTIAGNNALVAWNRAIGLT